MPCQQFPKNQPPANAKSGPFDTLAECQESIGAPGGCPCCSDVEYLTGSPDCAKCYCLLYASLSGDESCPDGFLQAFDPAEITDGAGDIFYPTCLKVIPDFDCTDQASCMPPQKYIDRGDVGVIRRYHCCCHKQCEAPTSAVIANSAASICAAHQITVPQWQLEGFSSLEECTATGFNECNIPRLVCPGDL